MPHLVLDTTENVIENARIGLILDSLVEKLGTFGVIETRAIKAYHQTRTMWRMGEGGPEGFVHLTLALLGGRPVEMRRAICHALYNKLKEEFAESLAAGRISVTLEMREMDPETYRK